MGEFRRLLPVAFDRGFQLGFGHLDLDAGALLLQQHRDAQVAVAPAAVQRLGQFADAPDWPCGIGTFSSRAELRSPGSRPCAPGAARRPAGRICRAGTDRPSPSKVRRRPPAPWRTASHSASGSTPALTPIVNTSARQRLDRVAGAVVHQLGDRAGADRADIAGLVADRVEHLLVPVEDLLVAADPQRQPARGGALAARR